MRDEPTILGAHYAWWSTLRAQLKGLQEQVHHQTQIDTDLWEYLLRMERKIMSALEDLNIEVSGLQEGEAALKSAVAAAFADLQAKLDAGGTVTDADIEAAAAAVHAVTQDLAGVTDSATAVDPGASNPAVTPTPAPPTTA